MPCGMMNALHCGVEVPRSTLFNMPYVVLCTAQKATTLHCVTVEILLDLRKLVSKAVFWLAQNAIFQDAVRCKRSIIVCVQCSWRRGIYVWKRKKSDVLPNEYCPMLSKILLIINKNTVNWRIFWRSQFWMQIFGLSLCVLPNRPNSNFARSATLQNN